MGHSSAFASALAEVSHACVPQVGANPAVQGTLRDKAAQRP